MRLGKNIKSDSKSHDFQFLGPNRASAENDFDDVDKNEHDFDFWQFNPGDMQDPQDQENLAFFEEFQDQIQPDEDGQVFIDLETTVTTNITERESYILHQIRQHEAEQKQPVNKDEAILRTEDKASKRGINDDKFVIGFNIKDFDKNIDSLDKSELRKPKDP